MLLTISEIWRETDRTKISNCDIQNSILEMETAIASRIDEFSSNDGGNRNIEVFTLQLRTTTGRVFKLVKTDHFVDEQSVRSEGQSD